MSSNNISLKGEARSGTIEREAADWFLAMEANDPSEKSLKLFDDWLAQSSDHREAYLEMELLGDALHLVAQTDEGHEMRELAKTISMTNDHVEQAKERSPASTENEERPLFGWLWGVTDRFRSAWSMGLAMSLLMAVIIWNALPYVANTESDFAVTEKRFSTAQGQIDTETLSDGSTVTLGPRSEIIFTQSTDSRNVILLKGEAFFDVVSDPEHPFYVSAAGVSVKVVGTKFDVRRQASGTSVSVVEGVVQVYRPENKDVSTQLTAGQRAVQIGEYEVVRLPELPLGELSAWRQGRLIYDGAELRDVLSDANRYSTGGKIIVSGTSLLNEKITLSLNSSEVNELPEMLAQLLPITVQDISGDTVISKK